MQGNISEKFSKEKITLQDLTSNCIFTRILQDPCKERIFSQPGKKNVKKKSIFIVHTLYVSLLKQ